MYLGKVIGTVVSTIKTPSLTGSKFLIVEKINQDLTAKKQTEIAVCFLLCNSLNYLYKLYISI